MKPLAHSALKACLIYTLLISFFMWQAFFMWTPNDAGMLVSFTAMPTSLLAKYIWPLRQPLADLLNLPVNDRFAMSFDAITGWFFGCLQYGSLAAIITKLRSQFAWV
jgi:hypothetical protein